MGLSGGPAGRQAVDPGKAAPICHRECSRPIASSAPSGPVLLGTKPQKNRLRRLESPGPSGHPLQEGGGCGATAQLHRQNSRRDCKCIGWRGAGEEQALPSKLPRRAGGHMGGPPPVRRSGAWTALLPKTPGSYFRSSKG